MQKVAIVGAGPYGLSIASFFEVLEIPYTIYGAPMGSWKRMLGNELLRSHVSLSCPANPMGDYLLFDWLNSNDENTNLVDARMDRETFLRFMDYFVDTFSIKTTGKTIVNIDWQDGHFVLTDNFGNVALFSEVVVATGLANTENVPFSVDSAHVVHSSRLKTLLNQNIRKALVVGAGQSAVESCKFLHESGTSTIHLAVRGANIKYNSVHQAGTIARKKKVFYLEKLFPIQSYEARYRTYQHLLLPSIEPDMKQYVDKNVSLLPGYTVRNVETTNAGRLRVLFSNNVQDEYDAVICATGFKPSLDNLPIKLSTKITIETDPFSNLPLLDENCESSFAGLFIVGSHAALRMGPQANFIFGTKYLTESIVTEFATRHEIPNAFL